MKKLKCLRIAFVLFALSNSSLKSVAQTFWGIGPAQNAVSSTLTTVMERSLKDVILTRGTTAVTSTATADVQNTTDYIIYAEKEVKFGEYNYISGDVGVTAANGKAEFKLYNILDPFVVKAADVHRETPSDVNNIFSVPATDGPSPTFYPYNGNTYGLSNIVVNVNNTVLNGAWKNVTVKKGIIATITGNNFARITIEEGAHVTFTAIIINMKELKVEDGKNGANLTIVKFSNPASVKIKDKVTVEAYTRVNVEGPQVTFYVGDNTGGDEKFEVKGEDNQVTANIIIPNGKLKIDGGSYNAWPTVMTGWYIIEKLDANCKFVYWNRYSSSTVNPPS